MCVRQRQGRLSAKMNLPKRGAWKISVRTRPLGPFLPAPPMLRQMIVSPTKVS